MAAPVFILGAPRSGTTLVYKLLCLHPGATWISNYVRRFPGAPELAALNRVAAVLPAHRDRAWFGDDGNAYVYGRRRPLWRRAFPAPVEGEPLFARHGYAPDAGRPCPEALRSACSRLSRAAGAGVLVSKRIDHNRRVERLRQAFPDARFVHVIRDGRAVAASLQGVDWWRRERLWWHDGRTVAEWEASGGDPWEACARHWVAEVEAALGGLAAVDPARVRTVRYEDVIDDPVGSVAALASFAGLALSVAWSAAVARVPVRGGTRPAAALPGGAGRRVEAVQERLLARTGYRP